MTILLRLAAFLCCLTPCLAQYYGTGSVTQGLATTTVNDLFTCTGGRPTDLGTITAEDKTVWTVPAAVAFNDAAFPFASDLHNTCNGHTYATEAEALAALDGTDIVVVDADGELITAYVFADNYFEMFINGVAVGKDRVPFTPFNSSIVRFRVKRPFTVAMVLVDWEEHLGVGCEKNATAEYHPGDGGMVAVFKDASSALIGCTDSTWKAQTFYTAPIKELSCAAEDGVYRFSGECSTSDAANGSQWYGLHWPRPDKWTLPTFNDAFWPRASVYTNQQIGVDNKPAYTNFTSIFDNAARDAQFIWSTNLILDNEVLVRGVVGATTSVQDAESGILSVYPNPTTDALTVDLGDAHDVRSVDIITVSGVVINSVTPTSRAVSFYGLPHGTYTVLVHRAHTVNTLRAVVR